MSQQAIYALFERQHGLVTRTQAMAAGLSRHQIQRRLDQGQWLLVHGGLYRLAGMPPSWETSVAEAVVGRTAVVSHRAAAALWGLELYRQPRPEITVPESTRYRSFGGRVVVHRSTQWALRDECLHRGLPCTGVDRTLLDCCAVMSWRRAERLAEAAIRKNLTSWLSLARCLMRHSRRGRNGCGTLRALLERRLGDQTVPLSDFSRLVSNLLVDAGLPQPQLEYVISAADGSRIFAADLAWPALRKAWELDGLAYHFGRTEIERDKRKRNRAITEGWMIQEILWSMYVDDPDGLVTMARRFLEPSG